eukprot:17852-Heterococcus_DN1.PRE.1
MDDISLFELVDSDGEPGMLLPGFTLSDISTCRDELQGKSLQDAISQHLEEQKQMQSSGNDSEFDRPRQQSLQEAMAEYVAEQEQEQQLEKQHQEQQQKQQQQQQQQLQDASQQSPTQAVPPGSLTVVATLWHPLGAVPLMVDASAAEPAALGLQLSDRIRMLTAITEGEQRAFTSSCIVHTSVAQIFTSSAD